VRLSERPISALLAEQLASQVRGVVVWLDAPAHYSAFVDRLLARADKLPYALRAFRGSYLELLLELEGGGVEIDPTPLLVYLPGVDSASIVNTPLYELHLASCGRGPGFVRPLEELVTQAATGKVLPDAIAVFVDGLSSELGSAALEQADAWLAEQLDVPTSAVAARLRVMRPSEVLDDLLGGEVDRRISIPGDLDALWERLGVWLGMPEAWGASMLAGAQELEGGQVQAADVAAVIASWALCVEYVEDLSRPAKQARLRGIRELPIGLKTECRRIAEYLRKHHIGFYRRVADETEGQLMEEVAFARAEDLGQIDTFRFEDAKVLLAAFGALADGQWDQAAEWAQLRIAGDSPWLRDDPHRLVTWQLILDAAQLGQALARAGELEGEAGLEGAVERYVRFGAAVDHAHRRLEQRRGERLDTQMPEFDRLRGRLDGMRLAYRAWADAWARDFNAIGRAQGFLPRPGLQQRMIFDEVVRESCRQPGTTALFMVDALRYEMAQELAASLGEREGVWLEARLAELPTHTAVGMNALAPVATRGRLVPVISKSASGKLDIAGFRAGEFAVDDPLTRLRAMHDRVGGRRPERFGLDELLSKDRRTLARRLTALSLVIIHSSEIDEAGESGQGLGVFARIIQKLRGAWHLLRSAGVQRFVITADHGFMLLDESTATAQPYKRRTDPKRRYVIEPAVDVDYPNETRVRLSELDYDGADLHIVFPETSAVFDTGKRRENFVHGGNSLQERVIPVLRLVHAAPAGGLLLRYRIVAKAGEQAGMHSIHARVELITEGALDFSGMRELELALRVDLPGVEVELGSVIGGGRIEGGVVHASIGEPLQIFFRLRGRTGARAQVEIHHPSRSVQVESALIEQRFAVIDMTPVPVSKPESDEAKPDDAKLDEVKPSKATRAKAKAVTLVWLEQLPEPVRAFFGHLATHGIVTATEAEQLLGGRRGLRSLAMEFDKLVLRLPFGVRIESVNGVKQYIREGS